MPKFRKGFTLIELLVVIGVLAVLLTITLIAINPARQFAQSNDTKRRSDVNSILNAIHQFGADNRGILPAGLAQVAATPMPIQRSATPDPSVEADICADVVTDYLAALDIETIDLLIISQMREDNLIVIVQRLERQTGREINYLLWNEQTFAQRAKEGHHLLRSIKERPVIMLKGDEDEFRRRIGAVGSDPGRPSARRKLPSARRT